MKYARRPEGDPESIRGFTRAINRSVVHVNRDHPDQGEVAMDRRLEHIHQAVDLARLLARGQFSAVSGSHSFVTVAVKRRPEKAKARSTDLAFSAHSHKRVQGVVTAQVYRSCAAAINSSKASTSCRSKQLPMFAGKCPHAIGTVLATAYSLAAPLPDHRGRTFQQPVAQPGR